MKYLDEIRALARLMNATGAGEVELRRPGFSVRIVLNPNAGDRVESSQTRLVRAVTPGRLRSTGTVREISLPEPGDRVQKNQVLAFLDLDGLTFAVRAPQTGTLTRSLARDGAPVECDDALFEVTVPGA